MTSGSPPRRSGEGHIRPVNVAPPEQLDDEAGTGMIRSDDSVLPESTEGGNRLRTPLVGAGGRGKGRACDRSGVRGPTTPHMASTSNNSIWSGPTDHARTHRLTRFRVT
jgi:hypothetical protein